MIHETENLRLDSDGDVYLDFVDADGEADSRRLGHVESCGGRVPDEHHDEYAEIVERWERAVSDRAGYEAGIEGAWARAKGW